jgi:MtN3 and saliva related transmembrane protein
MKFPAERSRTRSAEAQRVSMVKNNSFNRSMACGVLLLNAILLGGCEGLAVHDVSSLLVPEFQRSEVIGFVAGVGTTFAAVPDLLGMFKRRSSRGVNPTMAGIIGVFQIVWIYYGLLIASRPVIAWNMIGVVINLLTVAAFLHFARREDRATV